MWKTSVFFIFQNGFKQISLPAEELGKCNTEVIDVISCDDGCLIETEIPLTEACEKISKFIGYEVFEINCDTNVITKGHILTECYLTKGDHGEDCIMIWTDNKNIDIVQ